MSSADLNSKSLGGLHCLDLEHMTWMDTVWTGCSPFPRSGHASAVVGAHSLAVFGGKLSAQVFLNDIFILVSDK